MKYCSFYFFKLTAFTLALAGVFPGKKIKNKSNQYVFAVQSVACGVCYKFDSPDSLGFPEDDTVLEQRRLGSTTGRLAHVLLRMFHSSHDVYRTSYVRELPERDGNTGGQNSIQKQNRFKRILHDIICVGWNSFELYFSSVVVYFTKTCWLNRAYDLLITARK